MTAASALVVDDSKVIQFKLSKMLESRGLGTHVAGSGAEALAYLKTHRPDFVLMDYMMEDLDGYEVTRRIVADPKTAAIPVIICTGEDTPEARTRAAETGARGFMVKPVDDVALDRLLVALQAGRPREAAAPARPVAPIAESASRESAAALAQSVREAVERALGERLAAIERMMHGVAEEAAAAAMERALHAWRVEQADAGERWAQEIVAAAERAVDVRLAPTLEALDNERVALQAALAQVENNAVERARAVARQVMDERDEETLRAISADVDVLKAQQATLEQRLDQAWARVADTVATPAHDPAALEAIATAAAERAARAAVEENMRERSLADQPLADGVASPGSSPRRGGKVLAAWLAGLTLAVLWMVARSFG